tara:strand:+ start:699 stop:1190 length:492 start_codon:yes stop_codon:yes gene_type:complete
MGLFGDIFGNKYKKEADLIGAAIHKQIFDAMKEDKKMTSNNLNTPFFVGYMIGFVKAGFLVQGLSKDEATKQLNVNMKYICDGINPGTLWEIFSKKHQYMESVKTLLELDENPDADEGSSAGLWDGSNLITYNHHAPKTNLYFYLTGKKLNYLEPKGLDWKST